MAKMNNVSKLTPINAGGTEISENRMISKTYTKPSIGIQHTKSVSGSGQINGANKFRSDAKIRKLNPH